MTRWRVCAVSGQLTADDVGFAGTRPRDSTSSTPSSAATFGSAIGVVGDETHVERLRHAEHLGADVADAERAERAADQARRPCGRERLAKPAAASRVSWSLTISLPVSASINVMMETATGRRTPSGVITTAMPASVQAATSTVS